MYPPNAWAGGQLYPKSHCQSPETWAPGWPIIAGTGFGVPGGQPGDPAGEQFGHISSLAITVKPPFGGPPPQSSQNRSECDHQHKRQVTFHHVNVHEFFSSHGIPSSANKWLTTFSNVT